MESTEPLKYSYGSPARDITCGPDVISSLASVLDGLAAQHALIVCGPTILAKSDVIQRVRDSLGQRCRGVFSGVAPHAPVETLEQAVAMAKNVRADALVSVGGGSTHDTAKGLAVLLGEGGRIHDHQIRFEPPDKISIPLLKNPKLPIIAVSTTMGGAEFSRGAGFTDHALNRKISVSDPGALPCAILFDGKALATTPTGILVSTAMGQFRIAVESIYTRHRNPFGETLALRAIQILVRNLPHCGDKNIERLLQIKTAACMASLASPGSLGLNSALSHPIGGLYHVPHGEANAILLPHTMRFNLDACAAQQALIAEAMGVNITGMSAHDAGLAAADAVAEFTRALGMPTRLRDVDVPEDGLARIATATLQDRSLASNPKPIYNTEPIMQVLRAAW